MYKGVMNKFILIHSHNHPVLTRYYKPFYPNDKGPKVMPIKILNKLTPLGLAVWYQDDGGFDKRSNRCTLSIHKQNINPIVNFFKKKMRMNVCIYEEKKNKGASVAFNVKDTKKFFNIIRPHIHYSMKYKIEVTRKEQKYYKKMSHEIGKRYREKKRMEKLNQ